MEFSRQEYWSRLPFPPPGGRPNPGIKPVSLVPHSLASDELMSLQSLPLWRILRQRTSEFQDLSWRCFAWGQSRLQMLQWCSEKQRTEEAPLCTGDPKNSTPPCPTLQRPHGFLTFRKASEQSGLRGENFPAALAPDEECWGVSSLPLGTCRLHVPAKGHWHLLRQERFGGKQDCGHHSCTSFIYWALSFGNSIL